MKTKIIYLFVFLIFILILIIFFKSLQKPGQIQPQPVTSYTPIPATQTSSFTLISTNIPKQSVGITDSIRLTFNQPVSENLIFTLEPKIVVRSGMGASSYEFMIAPRDAWAFDTTYTLTISKSNLSGYNQSLDKDFVYTFKTPPYSGI